jgi:hypothetical protein
VLVVSLSRPVRGSAARTELTPLRQLALGAAWVLFIIGTCVALNAASGKTLAQAPLAGGALPPDVAASTSPFSASDGGAGSSSSSSTSHSPPAKPGVPVAISIPFASSHYPNGLHSTVTSHRLNADGSLFIPDDPKTVSWANQDAAPGSARGTVILTSHVNYVINGQTVIGAFSDLAEYARAAINKRLTLTLSDGRHLVYQVVAGREYNKHQLADNPALRADLYNQTDAFGAAGKPKSSRLLLVSCGGAFDNATGEYEDNVFLYALPVAGP